MVLQTDVVFSTPKQCMYERQGHLKGRVGARVPVVLEIIRGYHVDMHVGISLTNGRVGEPQRSLRKEQIMPKSLTFPVDGVTLPPCRMGFARSFDDHRNRSSKDLLVVVHSIACFESLDEH